MKKKKCTKCKVYKSIEDFNKNFKEKDKLHRWCKQCLKEHRKQYRETHKEEENKVMKIYREEKRFGGNKEKVFIRDGYKCTECKTIKRLEIHHLDGSGRGKENGNHSMENLVTICRSCHAKIHHGIKTNLFTKGQYSRLSDEERSWLALYRRDPIGKDYGELIRLYEKMGRKKYIKSNR